MTASAQEFRDALDKHRDEVCAQITALLVEFERRHIVSVESVTLYRDQEFGRRGTHVISAQLTVTV